MQVNNQSNESNSDFTRCLGIYHLLASPTGNTFIIYTSVIVILSVFSILSAVGNGLIIYVYFKQKSLQRTNTFLLVCLAFLDFVSAVLLEPLYVVRLLSEIFGFTSCVYILIVRRLLEYLRPVSFMTLALITIERYLALFKAIAHRRMVTKQRLLHVVLLIWSVWFLVICIRSIFPKITSVFYTFFTFVAFSLLVGNIYMYFKIGKLARLHSRPTRVHTAPGSLSLGHTNRGSISPGSRNQATGVMYSKTEESINHVGKTNDSRKIGIDPKSTRNNEQVCDKTVRLSGSDALSTEGELSHASGDELDFNKQKSNSKENKSQLVDTTTNKKAESNHITEGSNRETETNNNKSNSDAKPHEKATNRETLAKVENSRQHKNTTANVVNENHTLTVMEKNSTSDANANQTQNSNSIIITCDKTAQVKDKREESAQSKKRATPTAKSTNFTQDKNTGATSSANPMAKTDKTNKDAPQPNTRSSLKNTAKLAVETRERNATWTVFYIVAILTLCYLPIIVLLVYLSFESMPDATLLFIYIPIADTIALYNALVNPLIYFLKNRKMRAAVKSVLQRS